MIYALSSIAAIVKGTKSKIVSDLLVKHICIHTDDITLPLETVFAAMPGALSDGHEYIAKAYKLGVRSFIINDEKYMLPFTDAGYILVENVLSSLQKLAQYHRAQFDIPIISITGSNGKTIIKEWLYQMLFEDEAIVKSPKSYNSKIGVPLSLFQIGKQHTLGIFEAGISQVGEMQTLAEMIKPTIGIFTNIGTAHDEGFDSRAEKITEKGALFQDAGAIIYCHDHEPIAHYIASTYKKTKLLGWSTSDESSYLYLSNKTFTKKNVTLDISFNGEHDQYDFHLTDNSSIENIMHCITYMRYAGLSSTDIKRKIALVSGLEMRLEMKAGVYGSTIINDAYSADLSALKIALDFMQKQSPNREKGLIISKLEQSGMSESAAVKEISHLANHYGLKTVYYISNYTGDLPTCFYNYTSKRELLDKLTEEDIANKAILVKGARSAMLEEVVARLSYRGHSTTLTIDLDALAHNVRTYKELLEPNTEIIAVIKAGAYGSGPVEVARLLQQNGVTRLAVAFVDEAVLLRKQGVTMPIIVFNADINSLPDVYKYDLQLEVYGIEQLQQLRNSTNAHNHSINIHLKLDTGMHRLGFTERQLEEAINILKSSPLLCVETVFSHLAGSESATDDKYTQVQFKTFDRMYTHLCGELNISPKRHILNSSGITRFAERQHDMVRLGLGLYGIDSGGVISHKLKKVHTLVSSLLQVKMLNKGDSVGYNRNTILQKDTLTGVINIGYADGLMRNLGNGKYAVKIGEQFAPIIGNVSMDLIIVDLSLVVKPTVGIDVIIFDESHSLESLATAANTIPYEIMSRISERVERKYIRE